MVCNYSNTVLFKYSESVPVLLWDTEESQDLNINEALVSRGVAAFHSSLLSNASKGNFSWNPD